MTEPSLLKRARSLFIAGAWRAAGGGEHMTVLDPTTGAVLAELEGAGPSDVEAAVSAAVLFAW